MDYLVTGYPRGFGHYIEFGKVKADSKEDALDKFPKSVWYNYYVEKFKQEEYDELKSKGNLERECE